MSQMPSQNDWRELYRHALLESDPTSMSALVEEAYQAIQHRVLELSDLGSPETKERDELDAALYFLCLLRILGPMDVEESRVNNIVKQTYD